MPSISFDLAGAWEFKKYPLSARRMRDLDREDWLPTQVPSSIFDSLADTGRIDKADLYANPENYNWVSEKPWVYRKVFDAPAEILNCDRIDLLFEGLDTIASIWLNERLVGKTANMFVPHRFDVTSLLREKDNRLLVKFDPPAEVAEKLMDRYGQLNEKLPPEYQQRVYIRKAQYQFGWDFCPALPGCGIWRSIRLEGIEKARLEDIHIRTVDCNQHYADIKITVELEPVTQQELTCRIILPDGSTKIEHNLLFTNSQNPESAVIRLERPFLWWPSGYGIQYLYNLDVELFCAGRRVDSASRKLGIRTLRLDRSKDEYGEKFRFIINNRPIYVKGADWIPASIFPGSLTSNDYEKLLQMAKNANINMLRVWGGGYYENHEFYELCDRLGIMVWQDFMFACAYYPERKWFLNEVKNEAAAVIKRLRNHACLSLWCGNNEIDRGHAAGWFGKSRKFYGKSIYHSLLPQLTCELDPDRDYIPTTPLNPDDPNSGTIHQWNVWAENKPARNYLQPIKKIPRFVTEFGFASLPDMNTVNRFGPKLQLRIAGQIIEKHNYQLDGTSRLHRYTADLFGAPKSLEDFIYLSQLSQARACKIFVEHLRGHNFKNSGALFWQFNDCFPAITWSAIDYFKNPKALYYYTPRFFAPILITILPNYEVPKGNLSPALNSAAVVLINDTDTPIIATVTCTLMDFYSNIIDQIRFPTSVSPFSNSSPFMLPRAMLRPNHPEKCFIYLNAEKDMRNIAKNTFFYWPDKHIDWPDSAITHRLQQINDQSWLLRLKAKTFAKDVQITTTLPAKLSDNFFDLLPDTECEIKIECEQKSPSPTLEYSLHTVKIPL